MKWSCEDKRGACRNAFGCHCAEIDALQARARLLADALRPFIEGLSGTEAAKMIDKRYRGLNPIRTVITKFQFQAGKDALKTVFPSPQHGGK